MAALGGRQDRLLGPEPGQRRQPGERGEAEREQSGEHAVGPAQAAHVRPAGWIPTRCTTQPATRNSRALNAAWLSRCRIAGAAPFAARATATPPSMYATWLIVDQASSRLRSSCAERGERRAEHRDRSDHGGHGQRGGRGEEQRQQPGDEVDAGGDHGRGVDERRDRRRALHRVRAARCAAGTAPTCRPPRRAAAGRRPWPCAAGQPAAPRRAAPGCEVVPAAASSRTTASSTPRSPTRVTRNALTAAARAAGRSLWWPTSR